MAEGDIARELGRELAAGRAVLFTGAGFSVDALAQGGRPIPSGDSSPTNSGRSASPGNAGMAAPCRTSSSTP